MGELISGKFSPEQAADLDLVKNALALSAQVSPGLLRMRKKSLDARSGTLSFLFTAEVMDADQAPEEPGFIPRNVSREREVHIAGMGPAGMFAALQLIEMGLKPVILERGKDVSARRRDLARLNKEMVVDPDSNYCFGEGGAGTYSDGKLYTRSSKRGPVPKVLRTFVQFGAEPNIEYEAHPHIGTNKLPGIIEKMREEILACGGEIHFGCSLIGLELQHGKLSKLLLNGGRSMATAALILATGHSARDIYEMLDRQGLLIEPKPFALGVRVEHPQEIIDRMQYRQERGEFLPPASYSLVEQTGWGKGVFSFCMCPGGIIAPAATAPGEVVVNGWSPSKRSGKYANSGFVVGVDENDFAPFARKGALKGMAFQAHWEQKAFETANSLVAPAQRLEDFLQGRVSTDLPSCSYIPGLASRSLSEVLPAQVHAAIGQALVQIGGKMREYLTNEAVLVGVESRSSSPVRIPRDKERLHHPQVENLFPCAEGAGYAGGIVSAALDGYRCAAAVKQQIMI